MSHEGLHHSLGKSLVYLCKKIYTHFPGPNWNWAKCFHQDCMFPGITVNKPLISRVVLLWFQYESVGPWTSNCSFIFLCCVLRLLLVYNPGLIRCTLYHPNFWMQLQSWVSNLSACFTGTLTQQVRLFALQVCLSFHDLHPYKCICIFPAP